MSKEATVEAFKAWMIAKGLQVGTASSYVSGVNSVSKHCGQNVYGVEDVEMLSVLEKQYAPGGQHADIGAQSHGSAYHGLKQWVAFRRAKETGGMELGNDQSSGTDNTQNAAAIPLNQILFGPPGTSKTYATIDHALSILDPEFFAKHQGNDRAARKHLKARYDELAKQERVRFVTFHQSFSYEDFVEGLRAESDGDGEGGQIEYRVEPGVFKQLCDEARTQDTKPEMGIRANPRIWKISINGTGPSHTKAYCLQNGEARIGWGKTGSLLDSSEPNGYYQSLGSGDKGTLDYFTSQMAVGDILLCIHSADAIGAIGVVTGDYRYEENVPVGIIQDYQHVRSVRWLYQGLNLSVLPLNEDRQFTLKTVYLMNRFSWADLYAYLGQQNIQPNQPLAAQHGAPKPYVLIIDEINRGNVSRIFGELITLIEASKREGAAEALSVRLPYSKKPFSVPSNVYLLGTMNTADRSLSGLDIALRRRFVFKAMPPRPELLDDILIKGASGRASVPVGQLLRVMNQRIEVLLDRDHCLGHAYFMPLRENPSLDQLAAIFRDQILPLLQEYFFEDWQRIHWVLNDHRKEVADRFVDRQINDTQALFGEGVDIGSGAETWNVVDDAFDRLEAYLGVLDPAQAKAVAGVKREAKYGEYVLRQLNSNSIEVWREGKCESVVKPVLRQLAAELGVSQDNRQGNQVNTRTLGARLIEQILNQVQDAITRSDVQPSNGEKDAPIMPDVGGEDQPVSSAPGASESQV